jgi:hypothetical protein
MLHSGSLLADDALVCFRGSPSSLPLSPQRNFGSKKYSCTADLLGDTASHKLLSVHDLAPRDGLVSSEPTPRTFNHGDLSQNSTASVWVPSSENLGKIASTAEFNRTEKDLLRRG